MGKIESPETRLNFELKSRRRENLDPLFHTGRFDTNRAAFV